MHRQVEIVRRIVATALVLVIGGLGVTVPLLDGGPGHDLPAFEPVGASPSCVLGHDHGICTQYGATPLAVFAVGTFRTLPRVTLAAPDDGDVLPGNLRFSTLRHSRAPPVL